MLQFLCNGIEDDMVLRLTTAKGKAPSRPEALEAASGKLLLVRKLLTKLRSEKRRVLIFSQFKIMLDILEEMIEEHLGLPYERLDGDTKGALPGLLSHAVFWAPKTFRVLAQTGSGTSALLNQG